MHALLKSGAMETSRGQVARARREALGVSRDRLAQEAGLVSKTIKSYEEDARENMPSAARIEAALDRLEQQASSGSPTRPHRRATDSPKRRALEAVIETQEGEQATIYLLGDDLRAVFVVPEGMRVPTMEAMRRAIQEALDEE